MLTEEELHRGTNDAIADNAAFGAIVVGGRPIRPMDVDIRRVGATLSKNGIFEESGVSAAIMGHLAAGIARLANELHAVGAKLKKRSLGWIVYTLGRCRAGRCCSRRLWSAGRDLGLFRLTPGLAGVGACDLYQKRSK